MVATTVDIRLDKGCTDPLFQQIAGQIRSAIAAGHLAAGSRLPAARALAARLGVARGTVDTAYGLLADEGAVSMRRSAGTIVAGAPGAPMVAPGSTPYLFQPAQTIEDTPPSVAFRIDLPALDCFPAKTWSSLTTQAARSAYMTEANPSGLPALRAEVATYLRQARGIRCSAADVIITAGYHGALALTRATLLNRGDSVWIEDPGPLLTRQALEFSGAKVIPIRVDHNGLRVASAIAAAPRAKLAVVTPTHQCPSGVALSLPRRLELLAWAAEAGAWVLEADDDAEFRYAGHPLPSLKSLDRGDRVLYAGSFSKTLFPALRLGYLVVPPELSAAVQRTARLLTGGQPVQEQAVTAAFMRTGRFTRHIRRMRALYAERRQAVAAAMASAFGTRCTIEAPPGGLHLLARFPDADSDTALAKRAAASWLAPTALSTLTMAHDCGQGLLLGFTNIPTEAAAAMVTRLRDAILTRP